MIAARPSDLPQGYPRSHVEGLTAMEEEELVPFIGIHRLAISI